MKEIRICEECDGVGGLKQYGEEVECAACFGTGDYIMLVPGNDDFS